MSMLTGESLKLKRVIAITSLSALGVLGMTGCAGVNLTERDVTVCEKERTPGSDGDDGEYRVHTADAEGNSHTYRVEDTVIIGGWRQDSADFYGGLRDNVTYTFTSSGFRQGILSQFPNIVDAERLPADQQHPEWCS